VSASRTPTSTLKFLRRSRSRQARHPPGRSGAAYEAAPPPPSPSGEVLVPRTSSAVAASLPSPSLDASPVSHPIRRERVRGTPISANRPLRRMTGANANRHGGEDDLSELTSGLPTAASRRSVPDPDPPIPFRAPRHRPRRFRDVVEICDLERRWCPVMDPSPATACNPSTTASRSDSVVAATRPHDPTPSAASTASPWRDTPKSRCVWRFRSARPDATTPLGMRAVPP